MRRIASLVVGASIVLPQWALTRAFDAGLVRPPAAFYAAWAAAALTLGAAAALTHRTRVVLLVIGALVGTAVFYKVGIQTGRSSELANDLDWTVVLLLTAIGVGAGAAAVRVTRRQAAA